MDSIQGAGSIFDWCDECDDLVKALPSLIDQAFYRALTHQSMKRDTDPLVDCAWGASLSYALPIGLVPLVPMTHSLADRATDAALAYLAGLPGLFFLSLWSCHGTLSGLLTEFPVYLILEIKSRNQVSRLSSFICLGCANNINKGICYQIEWILTYFTRCDHLLYSLLD